MVDSCPPLDVNPDRPGHQLEPGTRQHRFSTPAHSSDHTSNHLCPGLSLCPVLAARLAAITASSIRNLDQDLLGRAPTPSQTPLQIHQSYPTDAEFHASLRTTELQPGLRASRLPAEIGSDSPSTYAVAPPSAEWNLLSDSSSTFNMTPW